MQKNNVPKLCKPESVNEERRLIDQVLEGRSSEEKARVLDIVRSSGIEDDDPLFLVLLVLTQCQLAVTPLPESFHQFHSDLEGFKVTAYEMRTEINRVTNSLRERALPSRHTSENPLSLVVLVKACAASFVSGVVVTIFLLMVLSFIKDRPLPSTSMLSISEAFQNGQNYCQDISR